MRYIYRKGETVRACFSYATCFFPVPHFFILIFSSLLPLPFSRNQPDCLSVPLLIICHSLKLLILLPHPFIPFLSFHSRLQQHWILDHRNQFPSGFVTTVDAETASILKASRFQHEFDFNKLPPSACGVPSTEPERDDPFVLAAAGGDSANGQSCCPPSDSSAKGKCC